MLVPLEQQGLRDWLLAAATLLILGNGGCLMWQADLSQRGQCSGQCSGGQSALDLLLELASD